MSPRHAWVLAALGGFVGLSLQLTWFRGLEQSAGSQPVVFGLLLGAYLGGLALGAAAIRPFIVDDALVSSRRLGWLMLASATVSYLVLPTLAWLAQWTEHPYVPGTLGVVVAAGLLGTAQPLLTQAAHREGQAASTIAGIYGANVAGSTLGPLVTAFLFFDHLSLSTTALVLCVVQLLAAFSCFLPGRHVAGMAAVVGAGVLLSVLHGPLYDNLHARLIPGLKRPLEMVVENKASVVVVDEDGRIYGGGVYDGVLNTSLAVERNTNMVDRAYLAFLLKPDAARVLEIGLAGGAWAQVLVSFPVVQQLTSVEINPGYLEVVARHAAVRSLLENPKVRIILEDGRTWLSNHPDERFDLVVMNTTFHWRSHATSLLSQEFLRLVKQHLNPGGVVYLNGTGSPAVARTMASEFPFTLTVKNMVAGSLRPFLIQRDAFASQMRALKVDGQPALSANGEKELQGLLEEPLGGSREALLQATQGIPLITDDTMPTEFPSR